MAPQTRSEEWKKPRQGKWGGEVTRRKNRAPTQKPCTNLCKSLYLGNWKKLKQGEKHGWRRRQEPQHGGCTVSCGCYLPSRDSKGRDEPLDSVKQKHSTRRLARIVLHYSAHKPWIQWALWQQPATLPPPVSTTPYCEWQAVSVTQHTQYVGQPHPFTKHIESQQDSVSRTLSIMTRWLLLGTQKKLHKALPTSRKKANIK